MVQRICSRENDRVKYARRLAASGAFRIQEGLFFAEGKRLCFDLAQNAPPHTLFYTEAFLAANPETAHLAGQHFLISAGVAEKLADTRSPQGLFCLFALPKAGFAQLKPECGVLLCEEVGDPANVGAALRSAAAFGYGGAVLVGGADPFSPKALRASMGAVLRLPVLCGLGLEEAAEALQNAGVCLYAAAAGQPGGGPAQGPGISQRFALLVGNEGAGLSQRALQLATNRVGIPMQNGVESLNAAVAASVLMYLLKNGL